MQAIDALQAALAKVSSSPVGPGARLVCEVRLYLSEIVEGVSQKYMQSRSIATTYTVSSQRQTQRLPMPTDLKLLARIELDPANRPVALWLHRLAFLQEDGSELWRWNGDVGLIVNVVGLAVRAGAEGLLLLSLHNYPQFDLTVPGDVLASLAANASLLVELTPRPLLEVCSEVLRQDDRLIAELRGDLLKSWSLGTPSLPTGSATSTMQVASDLENIASLLKNSLARRDQTIAQQSMHLEKMREEKLRAEAQLDLLKELNESGQNYLFTTYEDFINESFSRRVFAFLGLTQPEALSTRMRKQNTSDILSRFLNPENAIAYIERIGRMNSANEGLCLGVEKMEGKQ